MKRNPEWFDPSHVNSFKVYSLLKYDDHVKRNIDIVVL
jgi:hypothetical protein